MQPLDALFMEREGATFQFQKVKVAQARKSISGASVAILWQMLLMIELTKLTWCDNGMQSVTAVAESGCFSLSHVQ